MKIKLDENLPVRLAVELERHGYRVDTVPDEGMQGRQDEEVWSAAQSDGRFFITQDLDFSDTRRFQPGTHYGVLLVRLREPSAQALLEKVCAVAGEIGSWQGCFVVLTDHKIRVKRP